MSTAEVPVFGEWQSSGEPVVACLDGPAEAEMAKKQRDSSPAHDGGGSPAEEEIDFFAGPAGTGAAAEILAAIEPPEFMRLRPGQSRPLGRNASIPAEFVPWIEEVQESFGLSSFSDAALYLLCVAAKVPFQSVSSRRGFGSATRKDMEAAIRRRIATVHRKMREGTWVGRGPMKRPDDEGGQGK